MSSVRSNPGGGNNIDINPLTGLTINADWTAYGWFRVNDYDNASFSELFFIGDTLGNYFFGVSPTAAANEMIAYIYDGVAVEYVVTTNETDWIFMSMRHDGGTDDYTFSWRLEGETSLTSHVITANGGEANFTPFASVLGASDEGGAINGRKFVIRQDLLSDGDLLAESATLSAPPGTPLVYLDLDAVSGANTNLGTGSNWTTHGTLNDDTDTPDVALGDTGDAPLERAGTTPETFAASSPLRRLVNVAALVTAAVAADQPPRERHLTLREAPVEEPRIRRRLRLPESVDQPQFLLWALIDEPPPFERVQSARRSNPTTGPAEAAVPLLQRGRTLADLPLPEPRIARLLRLPESVDQPPPARRRQPVEAILEETHSRLLWRFPTSAAPAVGDQPPLPRRATAAEPLPEEPRPRVLLRLPESVDQPVLGTWEIFPDPDPEEPRIRRSPKLPDALITPVDSPPAPRWRTVSDTQQGDLASARSRWVLPSGAAPSADQPLSRWRTAFESANEERRIARLRRLPESVDAPPIKRRRPAVEEPTSDSAARHLLALPESVDLPPFKRWTASSTESPAEGSRNQRQRLLVPVADDLAAPRWRTAGEPSVEERVPRLLRRLPESYVPPPDDPPQVRWRTISDTAAEDLPIRRYRLLLASGDPVSLFVQAGEGRIERGTYRHRTAYGITDTMLSPKDPDSSEVFERDCSRLLVGRGTIASIISEAFEEGDDACAIESAATISLDGLKWSVKISGGTSGEAYRYRVRFLTSNGETLDASVAYVCADPVH